ncbi:hypothetical protein [Sphingosinicella sp. YJ22]|uniref:hypothetical protein n=1 Tax=Sphingosinicella sp. YJ22 TaxID=1104780 RepID=UPI001A9C8E00|nr:hypothetical protein [Sphingosinicella sp. YJ22]
MAPPGPPASRLGYRFLLGEDGRARGRPVGVTPDPRGALIVADELSNTIWRVTPPRAPPPPR